MSVTLEARQRSHLRLKTKDPLEVEREGKSLLMAGTSRGYLVLIDDSSGSVEFSTKVRLSLAWPFTAYYVCVCGGGGGGCYSSHYISQVCIDRDGGSFCRHMKIQ